MTGPPTRSGRQEGARPALGLPVRFSAIAKRYASVTAVEKLDLSIGAGEFLTLLGPSGSGKTTMLMMLAGFETPSEGEIYVGDRRITDVSPAKRNVGLVFQSYALFPHMRVEENVGFPLLMRGWSPADRSRRVREVLEIVDLGGLGARRPRQLSGGQQQRVALARAIAFEPPVLLMDEPLSALDKYLRSHLQSEIKRIQREMNITVVYVTHDQDEAMTMSDRICVMNHGRIRQIGAPEALYENPRDSFVAGFLGESNMLEASALAEDAGRASIGIAGARLSLALSRPARGRPLRVSVRPEHIRLTAANGDPPDGATRATVREVGYVGDHRRYGLRLADGTEIAVKQQASPGARGFEPGASVDLHWPLGSMRVFADGESLT